MDSARFGAQRFQDCSIHYSEMMSRHGCSGDCSIPCFAVLVLLLPGGSSVSCRRETQDALCATAFENEVGSTVCSSTSTALDTPPNYEGFYKAGELHQLSSRTPKDPRTGR